MTCALAHQQKNGERVERKFPTSQPKHTSECTHQSKLDFLTVPCLENWGSMYTYIFPHTQMMFLYMYIMLLIHGIFFTVYINLEMLCFQFTLSLIML